MKVGDKIMVIRMDDSNGKDVHSHRMNGVIGVIEHIDDLGQLHLLLIYMFLLIRFLL